MSRKIKRLRWKTLPTALTEGLKSSNPQKTGRKNGSRVLADSWRAQQIDGTDNDKKLHHFKFLIKEDVSQ
jgi:hypothetical protein